MKNKYLKNLCKLEFVVTNACTGRCKHCSEGGAAKTVDRIDPSVAADAVRRVTKVYDVQTVMAFGGEPLLNAEAVYAIMEAAKACGVPRRQVITNGYFTEDRGVMRQVAERLRGCGVNDLLLSVDAFHQETIPIETVMSFAAEAKRCGIPIRLQPAWLVSRADENPYNRVTREILSRFSDLEIPIGDGNVVFAEGNARKYLAKYFADASPENPYREDPRDVRCLSFGANGDLLGENVYRKDIDKILRDYTP